MGKILGDDWVNEYAVMEWNPSWNAVWYLTLDAKSRNIVCMQTAMGVIWIDLSEDESIKAYCEQMRAAIRMLEIAKKEYDTQCGNTHPLA